MPKFNRLRGRLTYGVQLDDVSFMGEDPKVITDRLSLLLRPPAPVAQPPVRPWEDEMVARMSASIAAEEDRAIFEALDAIARDPDFIQVSTVNTPADRTAMLRGALVLQGPAEFVGDARGILAGERDPRPELSMGARVQIPPDRPVGFQAYETVGVGIVNPRAVQVPTFDLVSSPSIPLADIRRRRFDMIDRGSKDHPLTPVQALWFAFLIHKAPAAAPAPEPSYFGESALLSTT